MRLLSMLVLSLLCQSAMAAPSDELALGLDKLHWIMSPQDAEARYPFIKNKTKHPLLFPLTNMGQLYIDDYAYAGCEFSGVLSFYDDKLYSVELTQTAPMGVPPPCRAKIESEFSTRYGMDIAHHTAGKPKDGHWYPFSGSYGEFKGPITAVHYELNPNMEISFHDGLESAPTVIYNVQLQHPPVGQAPQRAASRIARRILGCGQERRPERAKST
jgi:hypothetical protein